jgi:hypothetical protein
MCINRVVVYLSAAWILLRYLFVTSRQTSSSISPSAKCVTKAGNLIFSVPEFGSTDRHHVLIASEFSGHL